MSHFRIPLHSWLLLVEAMVHLLVLWLAIRFIPFRFIARRLGTCVIPSDVRVRRLLDTPLQPEALLIARAVRWAVACATHKLPFQGACLHQAIAARKMLRRRHVSSVLHLGASKEGDDAFAAHAWLEAAGVEITGYPTARQFVPIASFV